MILPALDTDTDRKCDLPSTRMILYLAKVVCQCRGKDARLWVRAAVNGTSLEVSENRWFVGPSRLDHTFAGNYANR